MASHPALDVPGGAKHPFKLPGESPSAYRIQDSQHGQESHESGASLRMNFSDKGC